MTPDTRGNVTLITLVTFNPNGTNGYNPQGGLILGNDGNFYGTTFAGGLNREGNVFRMSPNGAFTNLFSFTNTLANGSFPVGALLQTADGNFYGTTHQGGTNNQGVVFQITPEGLFTTLASLGNPYGLIPEGGLVQGADGNLYGTTYYGVNSGGGTVFRISTNGALATIASLGNTARPPAGLMQGADGNFYGTTENGGDYGDGTIFQVTPQGALTTLASFDGTNGSYPQAALIQATDGNFYGTAADGGTNSCGTIFRMTLQGLTGTIIPLVSFNRTNGTMPMAKLIQAADGNFYGTTAEGGVSNSGTIFQLTTNGTFTTLYSFTGGTDGVLPWTELTQNTNGDLYGTTGGTGGAGTIFVFNPNWPIILVQPVSRTNVSGTTATFVVSADGPGPLSYQWQKNGTNLNNGGNISGVNTTNLAVSGVSAADSGTYTGIVSNSFRAISSMGAVLTLATIPVINTPLVGQTNFYGWTSTFVVSANGIPSPTYQWQKNGTNLMDGAKVSGSTNAMLMLVAISYADAAIYSVIVSNAAGVVTNPGVALVVTSESVQNGSFETGDFSGWVLSGSTNLSGVNSVVIHSGKYSAQLGNSTYHTFGHLSQTIPTTPGTSYLLSLWIRTIYTANEFSVAWNTNSTSTNILFDQAIGDMIGWTNLQFIVTATETTATLDFGFWEDFNLDDVVVLPVSPANSPPPQLFNLNISPNDGAQFQISVNAGNSYRLQVSTNLLDWITLTSFIPFSNSFNFYDTQATNLPMRFYRVISP